MKILAFMVGILAVSATAMAGSPPPGAQNLYLVCNMLAKGLTGGQRCTAKNFPYTVPVGKTFCLTHAVLINKYAHNPDRYGGDEHTMYLEEYGFSVPAHHPEITFTPPRELPAGWQLIAQVDNGMNEDQYVYVIEQGILVDEGQGCLW